MQFCLKETTDSYSDDEIQLSQFRRVQPRSACDEHDPAHAAVAEQVHPFNTTSRNVP